MAALPLIAVCFGVLLGLRYNAWALLLCLGATVVLMITVMLLCASTLAVTAVVTFLVVAGMEIGYLAGAYAAQIGIIRRPLRSPPFSVHR